MEALSKGRNNIGASRPTCVSIGMVVKSKVNFAAYSGLTKAVETPTGALNYHTTVCGAIYCTALSIAKNLDTFRSFHHVGLSSLCPVFRVCGSCFLGEH